MSELLLPPGTTLTHELEVKRSRFLTLISRVSSPEEAREVINERQAAMPDARHHCNAFVVSIPSANPASHSSDDGEPSGTAGRPMLDVLAGTGLVDVVAVVTRYFGGTLLGTGGLVRAYSDAVRECLEAAPVVRRVRLPLWSALLPHANAGRYLAELSASGFSVAPSYEASGVCIEVPTDDDAALRELVSRLSSGSVEISLSGEDVREVQAGTIAQGRFISL